MNEVNLCPISRAYNNNLSTGAFSIKGEFSVNEYLSKIQDSTIANYIDNLSKATIPVFDGHNYFKGNCIAIAQNLVLTSRHCVDGQSVSFGPYGIGEVIFDGSKEFGHLDFVIIQTKRNNLHPVILDVGVDLGDSIQLYFKEDGQQYIKPFQSYNGNFATRSNFGSLKTSAGESGAPRMSIATGFVHAIHQGQGEGLKINDIYIALESASNNFTSRQQKEALNILNQLNVANFHNRYLSNSSIVLEQGKVYEEKARITGDVTVSLMKNRKKISKTFHYVEVGEGKGPRAITIHEQGRAKSQIMYNIHPNPHRNKKYNKGQRQFYEKIANAAGDYFLKNNAYSLGGKVKIFGAEYKLTKN